MKKYLVDIHLPAAGKHLNVLLPSTKEIGEVIGLLIRVAEPLTDGSYKGTPNTMLLDAESGQPFDRTKTVEEVGIRNASYLILI
jgi:hypothetical protein